MVGLYWCSGSGKKMRKNYKDDINDNNIQKDSLDPSAQVNK